MRGAGPCWCRTGSYTCTWHENQQKALAMGRKCDQCDNLIYIPDEMQWPSWGKHKRVMQVLRHFPTPTWGHEQYCRRTTLKRSSPPRSGSRLYQLVRLVFFLAPNRVNGTNSLRGLELKFTLGRMELWRFTFGVSSCFRYRFYRYCMKLNTTP